MYVCVCVTDFLILILSESKQVSDDRYRLDQAK
jgi:hypothetical protein